MFLSYFYEDYFSNWIRKKLFYQNWRSDMYLDFNFMTYFNKQGFTFGVTIGYYQPSRIQKRYKGRQSLRDKCSMFSHTKYYIPSINSK